jgi:large subunit ribosomal protein L9
LQAALEEAETFAQSLTGTRVVVAANAGDEGRLFGSISESDIATAITKFTGIEVNHKIIALDTPIKEIGLHEVALRPHPEVEFIVALDVIPA